MKYLKIFENFEVIYEVCQEYSIENYTINSDGMVDVEGHVYLSFNKLENIPIIFGRVSGFFNCSGNELTSLEGCPKEVGGYFECSKNHLSSLEGGPKVVGGDFDCSGNLLTSLKGCPKKVDRDFFCQYNTELTIIDCLPEWIEGNIDLSNNQIRDIKVEDKSYTFSGKCNLNGNPINDLFQYWEGDLKEFIRELEFEDFIRDNGKSVDILRFEYALNGKEYKVEDIKRNYKLIWKE